MYDLQEIQERYLRDEVPVRLGGIAANLTRVSSFSRNPANYVAVEGLLNESKYFIEWTAAETAPDTAEELVRLQVQIARWQQTLDRIWSDDEARGQLAQQSRQWADQVLQASGLLEG